MVKCEWEWDFRTDTDALGWCTGNLLHDFQRGYISISSYKHSRILLVVPLLIHGRRIVCCKIYQTRISSPLISPLSRVKLRKHCHLGCLMHVLPRLKIDIIQLLEDTNIERFAVENQPHSRTLAQQGNHSVLCDVQLHVLHLASYLEQAHVLPCVRGTVSHCSHHARRAHDHSHHSITERLPAPFRPPQHSNVTYYATSCLKNIHTPSQYGDTNESRSHRCQFLHMQVFHR
jgi:hypothetical protein